jgi:nucleoside-diphosphate-sugar epimerase
VKTGLIIGGTGRQGEAIVQFLSSTNQYHLLILTRNTTSDSALKLAAFPNVELVANNTVNGYDVASFLSAASRSEFVFVNTDGFTLGEQAEIYWGIRLFELARKAGVKHLIYSGLDYNGEETGFDPKFYVGHYEGKARVQSRCLIRCTVLHTDG